MDDISALEASAVFDDSCGFASRAVSAVLYVVLLRRGDRAGAVSERVVGLSREETSEDAVVEGLPYDDDVREVSVMRCLLLVVAVVLVWSSDDFVETAEESLEVAAPTKADLVIGEASEWEVRWPVADDDVVAVCDEMCVDPSACDVVNIDGEASDDAGVDLDGTVSSESGMVRSVTLRAVR